jgi:putative YhdH/YhfP family quinone oxidoreductase
MAEKQFLLDLGAKEVIHRDEVKDTSGRPVVKGRWAGVIDTVGGDILATAIKSTKYGGVVTCCGNVASPELPTTVFPFILRGVSLLGIDSANCPADIRQKIWNKLAGEWKLENLDSLTKEISLEELDQNIELILKGKLKGRTVVNLMKG